MNTVDGRVSRGNATRQQLLAVATELFAERGYEATSVELVLEEAAVSRGSLYHHFRSKEALFEAVLEAVEARVAEATTDAARRTEDPYEALRAGAAAWLRMAREPAVRRIVLIDAPAVVGWERWREIDERHAFGLLKGAVQAIIGRRGDNQSAEVLAHVLLAALIEVAMLIARASDPRRAEREGRVTVDRLLAGLLGD